MGAPLLAQPAQPVEMAEILDRVVGPAHREHVDVAPRGAHHAERLVDRQVGVPAVALDPGQAFELNGRFQVVVDQHRGDRVMGPVVNGENEFRHRWGLTVCGGQAGLAELTPGGNRAAGCVSTVACRQVRARERRTSAFSFAADHDRAGSKGSEFRPCWTGKSPETSAAAPDRDAPLQPRARRSLFCRPGYPLFVGWRPWPRSSADRAAAF